MREMGFDPLTGLGDHRSATTLVRPGSALAMIDLKDFRGINIALGHRVGDQVLKTLAGRLREGLAPYRVFRYGGDEFLVEIDDVLNAAEAAAVAQKMCDLIARPIDGVPMLVEARVGICLSRIADQIEPILREADRALFLACAQAKPFVIVGGKRRRSIPPKRHEGFHDVLVRLVGLLPEGVTEPDWDGAMAALATLSDKALVALVRQHQSRVTIDKDPEDGMNPTGAELYRGYLGSALTDASRAYAGEQWVHDLISFDRYPGQWHGRVGFVSSGYGLDEAPTATIRVLALAEAGLLEAAGFELMP